jgi:uncharacterized membrane protein YidH (DUF202 family)
VRTRIEPKTFFANERTFLSWLQIGVLVLMTGLGLLTGSTVMMPGSSGSDACRHSRTCRAAQVGVGGCVTVCVKRGRWQGCREKMTSRGGVLVYTSDAMLLQQYVVAAHRHCICNPKHSKRPLTCIACCPPPPPPVCCWISKNRSPAPASAQWLSS